MRSTPISLLRCTLVAKTQSVEAEKAGLYLIALLQISATLGVFFLAMLLYPDVQRQAQAELDKALGKCRPPTPAELERLPYLQALFKEVLRWHTVACLSQSNLDGTPNVLQLTGLLPRLASYGDKRRRLQRVLHPEGINHHSQLMVCLIAISNP